MRSAVLPSGAGEPAVIRTAPSGLSIYVFTETYPSLYKPYFDAQFEQFLADGHRLAIFALSKGDLTLFPAKVTELGLDAATRYLPVGLSSLPTFAWRIAGNALREPFRRVGALARARNAPVPRVNRVADAARLMMLPLAPPDLCLVHSLFPARRLRFLRDLYVGVPIAMYYHGGELPGMPEIPAHDAVLAFTAVDVVFTNTESSREHAISRGCPPGRIVVSPVGFRLEEFPYTAKRSYKPENRLEMISIGRLSREKGFNFAIDAVDLLVEGGATDLRYRIIGGGTERDELLRQIDTLGLSEYVELAGALSRESLIEAIGNADVLLLPSVRMGNWVENQACVVQEAMLVATPVIATATGGVPESIAPELRRYLVPEGDAGALADRIREFVAMPESELARLGRASRAFAESRYDIRQLNAQLIDVCIG